MTERKLASIQRVAEVAPIVGADKIEKVRINGWWVVTKKGEFVVGDMCVYFEVDSILPIRPQYEFLRAGCYRKADWIANGEGFRLRTVRLRQQLSQGLVIPIKDVWAELIPLEFQEGVDVTEILGVTKWEPPVPTHLGGIARGNFPSFIRKTDQERCLSGDSVVSTEFGEMCIKDIVDQKFCGKVASFNYEKDCIELNKVVGWSSMSRAKNWMKITLRSGKNILCTENHMVWCDDISAYRRADSLLVGQKVITKTEM